MEINSKHIPYPVDEHKVRLIMGDPIAQAAEWIRQYAEQLSEQCDDDEGSVTFDDLVDTGLTHVRPKKDGRNFAYGEYIIRGSAFEGIDFDPYFWDMLSVLKEIEIPGHCREHILSCSC